MMAAGESAIHVPITMPRPSDTRALLMKNLTNQSMEIDDRRWTMELGDGLDVAEHLLEVEAVLLADERERLGAAAAAVEAITVENLEGTRHRGGDLIERQVATELGVGLGRHGSVPGVNEGVPWVKSSISYTFYLGGYSPVSNLFLPGATRPRAFRLRPV